MRTLTKISLLAAGAALSIPTLAVAAPFGEPADVPDLPAGTIMAGSAIDDAGRPTLGGVLVAHGGTRAFLAFGDSGRAPSTVRELGPAGAYDPALATTGRGDSALTFSVKGTVYLTVCRRATCRPTERVASTTGAPESTVAVQPETGRTTVMWRGRTSGGARRLQWRITTGGKLGRTHTLGELGGRPRLATDRSGKTVAIWAGGQQDGLRTAARRVGEFTRPESVTDAPVAGQQLAVADDRFVAAWLSAPGGIDAQDPSGTLQSSVRTDGTSFASPQSIGRASTVSVAAAPNGRALISAQGAGGAATIQAATATSTGGFGALEQVATTGFLSTVLPSQDAIDDAGNVAIAYSGQRVAGEAGTVSVVRGAAGAFGAPEQLTPAAKSLGAVPVTVAIGAGRLQVAFPTFHGVQVRSAPVG